MVNFESNDSGQAPQENRIVTSEALAFFEDAYQNHKVAIAAAAGTAMALGTVVLTRGRSGSAALAAKSTLVSTGKISEIGSAKLADEITSNTMHHLAIRNLLIRGAVQADRPDVLRLVQLGLPRNSIDLATSRQLTTALREGNKGAVNTLIDDIFGRRSQAAMRRLFGH